jgi:hypothetical protein
MGSYSLSLQIANGVGLAISFGIASEVLEVQLI